MTTNKIQYNMKTKKHIALALAMTLAAGGAMAQKKTSNEGQNGGISAEMMQQMKKGYTGFGYVCMMESAKRGTE